MTLYRFTFLFFLLGCGAPAQVPGPASPSPKPAPQVVESGDWLVSPDQDSVRFGNEEGVRAYLVPVRSKADPKLRDHYLLRITGSRSKYDGLVVLVSRHERNGLVSFYAQLDGRPKKMLHHSTSSSSPKPQRAWKLFGYESRTELGFVRFVDQPVDSDEIVRLREQQKGEEIAKFETLTRASIIEANDRHHQKRLARVSKSCGKIESSIDWNTIPDELTFLYSIEAQCSSHLRSYEDFCTDHPGRLQRETKPIKLTCLFDDAPELDRDRPMTIDSDGSAVFTAGGSSGGYRQRLQLLREHYGEENLVLRGDSMLFVIQYRIDGARVYLGDAGVFYPLAYSGDYRETNHVLRSRVTQGNLRFDGKHWAMQCNHKGDSLEVVEGKERDALIEKARFETAPKWKRTPYFLARDTRGSYYYVDRYRERLGGGRYRVFVGRKGQLKLSKLKRLVEDTEGTLFSTAKGDLRLIVSAGTMTAVWIKGKKATPLTPVNLRASRALIFDELGVYFGEKLGFPCE